ncbi:MAG TPA: hypothetical protein VM186_15560, partial [Planctomycetota bacterium]|nr:hypothetical protein [Planctomycetota bacterium]
MADGLRSVLVAAAVGMIFATNSVAGENAVRVNDPETIRSVSSELEQLTGARTRMVWIQDAGPTACAFSEKPTLRLMGFDSRDGKGEREIAPIGSYVKPLFTADGNQIVFGNNVDNRIYVVNWDGTGQRAVTGPGTSFEDVWTDPRDGLTWIYAQLWEKRGDKDVRVIRRFRLDKPEMSELVWDRMQAWHFQLSGDGRTASAGSGDGGNSMQGMFTLPNGNFYNMGGGCWPSAAPDFSNRAWVFRGHHRGIYVFEVNTRTGKSNHWPVEFEG